MPIRPAADSFAKRIPYLAYDHEHAEQDELRDDELDPEEELVAVGSLEGGRRDSGQRAVCELEVAGDDALPERPRGCCPETGEREQHDRSHRRAPVRQTVSGSSNVCGRCSGAG